MAQNKFRNSDVFKRSYCSCVWSFEQTKSVIIGLGFISYLGGVDGYTQSPAIISIIRVQFFLADLKLLYFPTIFEHKSFSRGNAFSHLFVITKTCLIIMLICVWIQTVFSNNYDKPCDFVSYVRTTWVSLYQTVIAVNYIIFIQRAIVKQINTVS